jgi:hypothetical protein
MVRKITLQRERRELGKALHRRVDIVPNTVIEPSFQVRSLRELKRGNLLIIKQHGREYLGRYLGAGKFRPVFVRLTRSVMNFTKTVPEGALADMLLVDPRTKRLANIFKVSIDTRKGVLPRIE